MHPFAALDHEVIAVIGRPERRFVDLHAGAHQAIRDIGAGEHHRGAPGGRHLDALSAGRPVVDRQGDGAGSLGRGEAGHRRHDPVLVGSHTCDGAATLSTVQFGVVGAPTGCSTSVTPAGNAAR